MAEKYKITFAGVAFRHPNADVLGRLDRFGYPNAFSPEAVFPGPEFQKLGVPDLRSYPKPAINQWFYPVGASRTSVFRGLMTADDIETVKGVVWGSGTPVVGDFVIQNDTPESQLEDGTGKIQSELWMLPPVPLVGTDLFIVVLVDERYFWHQFDGAGVITCTGSTSDWSEIINQIETALQISITHDAPSSDYGYPDPDSPLYSNLGSPAVLLDAVAANIGCCVVRGYDGEYSLVRWSDSHSDISDNRPDVTAFGGEAVDTDGEAYRSVMPESVQIVFPKWIDGAGYYEPESKRDWCKDSYGAVWTYDVTLSAMGTPYSSYKHNGFTKILRTTAKAQFTLVGDASPNNATACQTLAVKLAKDYCDARKSWVDETCRGIRNVTPEGVSDFLFCFDERLAWTRIIPPPFNSGLSNFQHSLVNGGLSIPVDFTIEEVDGSPSVPNATKLQLPNSAMSNPSTGVARLLEASSTTGGTVTLSDQVLGDGTKTVEGLIVAPDAAASYGIKIIHGTRPVSGLNAVAVNDQLGTGGAVICLQDNGGFIFCNSDNSDGYTFSNEGISANESRFSVIDTLTPAVRVVSFDNYSASGGAFCANYGFGIGDSASATLGVSGTIGPGATSTLGLVTNSGSGSFVSASAADITGSLALSGDVSPAQLTANTDNWNPTGW